VPNTVLPQFPAIPGDVLMSEFFGPTYQGEGLDIGKPCFFVRLHSCPVKCPGCDTHYTWDGTERGDKWTMASLADKCHEALQANPGCGFVFSGGEPLIHYNREEVRSLAGVLGNYTWVSLETSGFVSRVPLEGDRLRALTRFVREFNVVHLSPKVTPCLHGEWTDDELLCNVQNVMDAFVPFPHRLAFKFVARDEDDLLVIANMDEKFRIQAQGHPLMVMPYGVERDEVVQTSLNLLPALAHLGYVLSPRLHTMIWGKKRGV
jgi:organic radical activating enzyme